MRTDEEKFTRGRVTMREKFSDDLWRFRVDPGEGFKFVAGQYATLGVEKDGKRIEREVRDATCVDAMSRFTLRARTTPAKLSMCGHTKWVA